MARFTGAPIKVTSTTARPLAAFKTSTISHANQRAGLEIPVTNLKRVPV